MSDLSKDQAEFLSQYQRQSQFELRQFCFDAQLQFIQDPEPFKVAVCSRRAGKTVACAAHLMDTALRNKDAVCLYITLSRNNAKKLIWREIKKINTAYGLGGVPDNTELSLAFPDRDSIIYLSGAKDSAEIEKFRGLPMKLAYIDECQSFRPYIEDLVDDVIAPALMDYAGHLSLIGTPGPVPTGYFHNAYTQDNGWAKHHWTFWDNPFIASKSGKTHREILERELKRRGVTIDDPSIQREWFGKWILDSDSLLIHYDAGKNHYDELPRGHWTYLCGIDLGFEDADAIAVIAWHEKSPETYLVEEIVTKKQGLSELAAQIQKIMGKYNCAKYVIDEGGLGKKLAEEMRRRFQLPLMPADKARKFENVALLNDSLRSGRFKAKKNSLFAQDSFLVEIDREKSTPERIRVKDSYHSDIIDAVLYAFKESQAFTYQPEVKKPKWGSKEWADEQVTEMERLAEEHFKQQEGDDWESYAF